MIPGFHGLDLLVILVVALLIFGPRRLPEMGSAIGKSIKEFRKGMSELTSPKEAREEEESEPKAASPEAIDQEIASKKAHLEALDREIASRQASSEVSNTETKAE
jgi:sec-independent protein translocase protein TatA